MPAAGTCACGRLPSLGPIDQRGGMVPWPIMAPCRSPQCLSRPRNTACVPPPSFTNQPNCGLQPRKSFDNAPVLQLEPSTKSLQYWWPLRCCCPSSHRNSRLNTIQTPKQQQSLCLTTKMLQLTTRGLVDVILPKVSDTMGSSFPSCVRIILPSDIKAPNEFVLQCQRTTAARRIWIDHPCSTSVITTS
jgi:hypothetical protein